MDFDKTISLLKEKLISPLPGQKAHFEMYPQNRPLNLDISKNISFRESAVSLLIYPKANATFSVLIERTVYNGIHSGQISLPGGKKENIDLNLSETALRETNEEIGIRKEDIHVIGCLSELYIPPSNFKVFPIIGYINSPVFEIDRNEVNSIIEYDIDILLNQTSSKTKLFNGFNYCIEAPYFDINGYSVWGATAMILNELRWLIG